MGMPTAKQSSRTLPSSVAPLSSRQASALSSVDLPAPLGPVVEWKARATGSGT